jgi:subtilisin family serine protease
MKMQKLFILFFPASLALFGAILILPVVSTAQISREISDLPFFPEGSARSQSAPEFFPNEFLIKISDSAQAVIKEEDVTDKISANAFDTGLESINKLNQTHGVKEFKQVANFSEESKPDAELFRWYKVTLEGENEVDKKIKANAQSPELAAWQKIAEEYRQDPNVELVEPNYVVTTMAVPNDPYYPLLWGLQKINMEPAWDKATGSPAIVIASIDTGVDYSHPDLQGNTWTNDAETPDNNIDDDKNGYIDDYYGWDWVDNDNDPMDDNGHGTHTAGTIAAVGNNNLGVAGVNWTSKIMALKFLNAGGWGTLDDGVKALKYAADKQARISSNSWGCWCKSTMIDDALAYEHVRGMVVVVAAGNSKTDALDFSPASSDHAITVAASDQSDRRADFPEWGSNWGQKIDVTAPGVDILSLRATINNSCADEPADQAYCRASGTSMAAPHVAGLAALLLAKNPTLTNEEVRQILRSGALDLGNQGKDKDYGYGRIDAIKTLDHSDLEPLAPFITSPKSRAIAYGVTFQNLGRLPGENFASYRVEFGAGREPTNWILLFTSTTQPREGSTLANLDTTKLPDGTGILRLTAVDTNGKEYGFQVHDIDIDNTEAFLTFPLPNNLVSIGGTDILGTARTKHGVPFQNNYRYILEWGVGIAPTSWSSAGITLQDGGLKPVQNGKLGTWDTSRLTDGQTYSLRLTILGNAGNVSQTFIHVQADKDLISGWPKILSSSCDCILAPTIADLDGDGNKEIIIAGPDNAVNVFRKDGTNLPGFPLMVEVGEFYRFEVNVDDLDGDGKKEIIALVQTALSGPQIRVIRSDGTLYGGWESPVIGAIVEKDDAVPTVADLDNDGKKELVALELARFVDRIDAKLNAFHLDGTQLSGFPKKYILPPEQSSPSARGVLSIVDLDKDLKPEIAWGHDNRLYLFDNTGTRLPNWPFVAPNLNRLRISFESALASGDVDGDGELELFAIGKTCDSCDARIYGFRKNGSALADWPKTILPESTWVVSSRFQTPTLANVDDDAKDEIIVGQHHFAIFDQEGEKTLPSRTNAGFQPSASDVSGDGKLDFFISGGNDHESYANGNNQVSIVNDDSSKYWQRVIPTGRYMLNALGPGALADVDENGKHELALVNGFTPTYADLSNSFPPPPRDQIPDPVTTIFLWEIPTASSSPSKYEWPMFNHDPARSGRLISDTDTTSPIVSTSSPQDTFINLNTDKNSAAPTLNLYTWPDHKIANAILMKFDLSSIPAGSIIQSATLKLFLVEADAFAEPAYTVTAHGIIKVNPDLAQADGLTYDGVNAWTANDCCYSGIPMAQGDLSTAYDTQGIDQVLGIKSFNLTQMVQEWINIPASNFGLLLNSDNTKPSDRFRYFGSMENADPAKRPQLTIVYSTPRATSESQ